MYTTNFLQKQDLDKTVLLLKNILNASNDGLCVCDQNGHILLYNEAYLQITGISTEVLNQYSAFELLELNFVPNGAAVIALKTKEVYNTMIDYHNGKKAIVTATPFTLKETLFIVSNVRDITELNRLEQELEKTKKMNAAYQKAIEQIESNHQFIYKSKEMVEVVSLSSRFAKNDSPILLLGESGVGKDVLANYIHKHSEKRMGPFIKINCGAIPDHLLESELFGYEKGAFTGAMMSKEGLFELAHGGTIFLDEIGDLPYHLQVKLLNVLQDYKIRRLGGSKTYKVDLRVIAATNSDLRSLVEKKLFRLDLYYRLNVLSIVIPPLRERCEDIPALTHYFLNKLNQKYKLNKQINHETIKTFINYDWPGNIRELSNMVERLYFMSEGEKISLDQLPSSFQNNSASPYQTNHFRKLMPLKQSVAEFEKEYIANSLSRTSTLQECANELDINISTLVRKKRLHQIK